MTNLPAWVERLPDHQHWLDAEILEALRHPVGRRMSVHALAADRYVARSAKELADVIGTHASVVSVVESRLLELEGQGTVRYAFDHVDAGWEIAVHRGWGSD